MAEGHGVYDDTTLIRVEEPDSNLEGTPFAPSICGVILFLRFF